MNLTAEQKQTVAGWLKDGLKLSEVQDRIEKQFGARLTYLEVRLLVDDLRLVPKDPEAPVAPAPPVVPGQGKAPGEAELPPLEPEPEPAGGVSVTVDTVTRPGALVSGRVNFSDGQQAEWFLDQMGRLGLMPRQQGYRPSPADMQAFQMQLERELQNFGV